MVPNKNQTATVSPEFFWRKLFRTFHERTRHIEPADFRHYQNIRRALYTLRTYTGMTGERLALEIGIPANKLNLLEMRGGTLHQDQCLRCAAISREFYYPKLAEFFDLEAARNSRLSHRRRGMSQEIGGE